MKRVHIHFVRWLSISILSCILLTSGIVWGNAQFKKAVQHFKDFEIKQAVGILTQLKDDPSLSSEMKAKVSLYLGMSYAYLRKKTEAKSAMAEALRLQPSVTLPAGTPKRLRKLFEEAKGGAGNTPPIRTTTPPPRTTAPPPRNRMDFGSNPTNPPPSRRTTAPPPRRSMSFGMGFSIRKRPVPVRRRDPFPAPRRETFPAARREAFPAARRETFPPARSIRPTPARRRTAPSGPDTSSLFGKNAGLSSDKKSSSKKGGGSTMWTLAWVASATAVALAGGGVGMGAFANNIIAQVPANTVQIDIPQAQSDAERFATIANSLYIASGAIAVSAVVFFIFAAQKPKPKPSNPALSMPPVRPSNTAYTKASKGSHYIRFNHLTP